MTDTNLAQPRKATAVESSWLQAAGYTQVDAIWWRKPSGEGNPLTADEALEECSLSIAAGADYRSGLITTEFWTNAVVIAPLLSAGVAAIAVPLQALPSPWNAIVGLGCAFSSAVLAALYTQARTKIKTK